MGSNITIFINVETHVWFWFDDPIGWKGEEPYAEKDWWIVKKKIVSGLKSSVIYYCPCDEMVHSYFTLF